MFKKSIFYVCMFVVVSIFIINSAFALNIGFDPNAQTVFQGYYATVDIKIDTYGFGLLSGYDLLLDYDPFILNIENDDISLSELFKHEDLKIHSSQIEVDPNSGTIHINMFYDYSEDSTEVQLQFLNLATLNFFALNEGTSYLKFSSVTLYDDTFIIYDPYTNEFSPPRLVLNIDDPMLAAITTNGEISVSAPPPTDANATPEPSTLLLLGISSLMGLGYSKRKKLS